LRTLILPNLNIEWDDVWIGAFATALLFTLGKFLIGLYLGKSAVASSYGAAGAVVILLIWMYYPLRFSSSAQNLPIFMRIIMVRALAKTRCLRLACPRNSWQERNKGGVKPV
jgi:Virulence factor BrkB